MSLQAASIIVTVVLALLGLLGKYLYDLRLARRKDALELVNKRLNDFYGPLYVACQVGAIAADALRNKLGGKQVFLNRLSPTPQELAEWKVWLPAVLMPLNEVRERLILKNSHLILETEFPTCLLRFVAHTASYKAVLKRWKEGDFSEVLGTIDFPRVFDKYASDSYLRLKAEQSRLINGDA